MTHACPRERTWTLTPSFSTPVRLAASINFARLTLECLPESRQPTPQALLTVGATLLTCRVEPPQPLDLRSWFDQRVAGNACAGTLVRCAAGT